MCLKSSLQSKLKVRNLKHQMSLVHENSVDAICCDPTSDRYFASGSHDKTIKLWDAQKPQKPLNTLTGNKAGIWSLNYDHEGKRLVSASSEGFCKIWDVKSGKCATELLGHAGAKVSDSQFTHKF